MSQNKDCATYIKWLYTALNGKGWRCRNAGAGRPNIPRPPPHHIKPPNFPFPIFLATIPYMKIVPMSGKVLIKPLEAPTETAGGILLPDDKKINRGVVIHGGDSILKEGVTIYFSEHGEEEIVDNLCIIEEDLILAYEDK